MKISEKLEQIKEEICDNYCKYPYEYQMNTEDSEEAFENMLQDVCSECPLNRL